MATPNFNLKLPQNFSPNYTLNVNNNLESSLTTSNLSPLESSLFSTDLSLPLSNYKSPLELTVNTNKMIAEMDKTIANNELQAVLLGGNELDQNLYLDKFNREQSLLNEEMFGTDAGSEIDVNAPKGPSARAVKGMGIAGAVADIAGSFIPEKSEYSGDYGNITKGMDLAYDAIADAAAAIPGVGTIISGAMKLNALASKGMSALGAGTDGMTKADAVLGSAFFQMTPLGIINGALGSTTDTITKNTQAFDTVGASYSGTNATVDDAVSKSDKKYGLISRKAFNLAQDLIHEGQRQQSIMSDIADETTQQLAIQDSMSSVYGNRRAQAMQGGYNQKGVRIGKSGLSLDFIGEIKDMLKKDEPFNIYYESLPENQKDSSNYRVKEYWEYNGKPKNFEEAVKKGMFIKQSDGKYHAYSIAINPNTGEIEFMKRTTHPTMWMEEAFYEGKKPVIKKGKQDDGNKDSYDLIPLSGNELTEWEQFRKNYKIDKSEDIWKYIRIPKEELKEGGKVTEIYAVDPSDLFEEVEEFKEGGKVNVIPEGALHARKHNMDIEGITQKGIPVVSEEGGKIELHAEIERSEIIFRIETTKKLEELCEKYYDEETTNKDKEECALEAGKLLTYEILHNTLDNTNTLL